MKVKKCSLIFSNNEEKDQLCKLLNKTERMKIES